MKKNTQGALVLNYLKQLCAHNNREWFAEHRTEYEEAKAAFEEMTQQAIERITTFDESIKHLQPKDCVYRIYRDVRFSLDKSPYKNHFGAYMNAQGKKSLSGGYYIHIQPEGCMLAGGSYCVPPKIIQQIRQSIVANIDEYKEIIENPDFQRYFPQIGEEQLKSAPKGFKKDDPLLPYLKPKTYDVVCPVPDSFFLTDDWIDRIDEAFRPMKPYLDFINYTINECLENGESL